MKVKFSLKFIPNGSVLEHRARKCGLWRTHAFIPFLIHFSVRPSGGRREREEGKRSADNFLVSGRPSSVILLPVVIRGTRGGCRSTTLGRSKNRTGSGGSLGPRLPSGGRVGSNGENDCELLNTRLGLKAGLKLREWCNQSKVVSNSRNKIRQTWGPPLANPYVIGFSGCSIWTPMDDMMALPMSGTRASGVSR